MNEIKEQKFTKTYDDYTFELRGYKKVIGHDDSLPFNASLYINNKKVATCYNDGWGGEAVVEVIEKYRGLYDRAIEALKRHEPDEWYQRINNLVDMLACKMEDEKIRIKYIKRNMGSLIFANDEKMFAIQLHTNNGKSVCVQEAITHAQGKRTVDAIVEKYEKQGYEHIKTY